MLSPPALGLYVLQRIGSTQEGNGSFTLSGDYYNRELSGGFELELQLEVTGPHHTTKPLLDLCGDGGLAQTCHYTSLHNIS